MNDPIGAPAHYRAHPSGLEAIQITEHYGFNLGNAIKYLWRSGHKGHQVQDLHKALWYLNREIERIQVVGHAVTTGGYGLDALWGRVLHSQPDGHLRDTYRCLRAAGGPSDPHSRLLFAAAWHVHAEIKRIETPGDHCNS